ncbi:hypothetical protein DFH09DRAFT_1273138 [Mycena vulgaris]|nr:hypothetical protein DFH09DRAFT_1273138 [Mycena vulgaris]
MPGGRPLGSKDKARPADAPQRGHPSKIPPHMLSHKGQREERLIGVVVPANLVASTMSAPSSRVSDGPDGDAAGTPFGLDFDLDSNSMHDPISSPPGSSTVGSSGQPRGDPRFATKFRAATD